MPNPVLLFCAFSPNKKETENKTIRFPIPLIDKIEKAIRNKNVTFSRFVIQACEYALNNIDSDELKYTVDLINDWKEEMENTVSFNF